MPLLYVKQSPLDAKMFITFILDNCTANFKDYEVNLTDLLREIFFTKWLFLRDTVT